jgi:hypothetical protein
MIIISKHGELRTNIIEQLAFRILIGSNMVISWLYHGSPNLHPLFFFNHIPFPGVVEARAPLGPPRGHGEERANVHVATEDQGAV